MNWKTQDKLSNILVIGVITGQTTVEQIENDMAVDQLNIEALLGFGNTEEAIQNLEIKNKIRTLALRKLQSLER